MAVFKCKMCGGTLQVEENQTTALCEYCGTRQTLPKLGDDRRAQMYDRANHFRRNNEYDKAEKIYEQILNEDNTDAEAYWSLVLCRYGVEYVEDPSTYKRLPTVNRTQFTSVFDDEDYKSALQYADAAQKEVYEQEAQAINEIQKGILAISQKEEPFDIFICYKETDENGRRTPDSVLANELYYQLTQEGFKVFFSRITLEDKLGTAYEPYIFAALNSAKIMVVLGTKSEYFKAVWVKNEWSRYLALVKQSHGKKTIIPAYRDMDPYDLPEEFSHLQALDMSKLGFMQDLIHGIRKIISFDMPKPTMQKTVLQTEKADQSSLLKRGFLFLEEGDWYNADKYFDRVLDSDPENAQAYLGKLMEEMKCRRKNDLANVEDTFEKSINYKRAIEFGDDSLKAELKRYNNQILEIRNTKIYENALKQMNDAYTVEEFNDVAKIFKKISSFKDAEDKVQECLNIANEISKENIYTIALNYMNDGTTKHLNLAIDEFSKILDWKDSKEQISICQKRINELAKKGIDSKKRTLKIIIIMSTAVVLSAVFGIIIKFAIIPPISYQKAVSLMENNDYSNAYMKFVKILNYKNSASLAEECEEKIDTENLNDQLLTIKSAEIASTVEFGRYDMDNNPKNGKEIMEWIVIGKNGDSALLISKYCLPDFQQYNDSPNAVEWENCSLRQWLNSDFLSSAFVEAAENKIMSTNISDVYKENDAEPEYGTVDKVFILDSTEIKKCFPSKEARKSQLQNDENGGCGYWLRWVDTENPPFFIDKEGEIKNINVNAFYSVRPALWVKCN